MKLTKLLFIMALALVFALPGSAKKYKWTFGTAYEVYNIGQGGQGTQLVRSWATGKNADKAIEQAMMNAVSAALFSGIAAEPDHSSAGTSTLRPLVKGADYDKNKDLFDTFFKSGEFLSYVSQVHSQYPAGQYNVSVPGGRRVGVELRLNREALRQWLIRKGIKQDIDRF